MSPRRCISIDGVKMVALNTSDLQLELREQISALRASCNAYDAGQLWEAKRLATSAYILLHDGGRNSKALLSQLGLKTQMQFLSTRKAILDGDYTLSLTNITFNIPNGTMTYSPTLAKDTPHNWQKFSKWYDEKIFGNAGSLSLTRKNIIFALRNKMGGSHVDARVDDDGINWLKKGAHSITINDTEFSENLPPQLQFPPVPQGLVPNNHFAVMRQIAYEISESLS